MNVKDVVMKSNSNNDLLVIEYGTNEVLCKKVYGESFYKISAFYDNDVTMISASGNEMQIYIDTK